MKNVMINYLRIRMAVEFISAEGYDDKILNYLGDLDVKPIY